MTVIVSLKTEDGYVLGSDTLVTNSYIKHEVPNKSKWKKYGRFWIAWAGLDSMDYVFEHFDKTVTADDGSDYVYDLFKKFRNYCIENNIIGLDENKADSESVAMIIYNNRCYIMYDDFVPIPSIMGINVCGTGGEMALGYLYASRNNTSDYQRVRQAIKCCDKYSDGCKGIGEIFKINRYGDIV